MKVQVIVSYREKNKARKRELIFNPTDGDWPRHLWSQLAYKVFLAYGDEKLGDYCQAVTITYGELGTANRIFRTYGNHELKRMAQK